MTTIETIEFVIFLLAMSFYIWHILADKNFIPSPIGFGIWLLADTVNLFTYLDFSRFWVGPVIMVLAALSTVIIGIIRTVNTKVKKKYKLAVLDWLAIIISISSLIFWMATDNAMLSNMAIQLVLAMGFIPVIKELIAEKKIEPLLSWGFFALGFLIVFIHTLNHYEYWEELIYSTVGVIGDLVILILSGYNKVIKSISWWIRLLFKMRLLVSFFLIIYGKIISSPTWWIFFYIV